MKNSLVKVSCPLYNLLVFKCKFLALLIINICFPLDLLSSGAELLKRMLYCTEVFGNKMLH